MTGTTTDIAMRTARGIFLGAAVGDALGWPQEARGGLIGGQKERDRANPRLEFRDWTRHAGHYSSRYQDPVRAGEYSDDTQLLLATARSCLVGEHWWERLTQIELPTWPVYQRGGGGAVLTAAASWAEGRPPWRNSGPARAQAAEKRYRDAGANGVAMRIAPHVLWASSTDDLVRRVVLDGIATHGHPRALVGALVYAFALFHAASSRGTHGFGDSVEAAAAGLIDIDRVLPALPPDWGTTHDLEVLATTWQETNKETVQLLELIDESLHRGALSNPDETLERIGCTDPKVNGAGTISAVAAVYLASRFAARPQEGLLSAAFLRKADTDTLASLAAAILGALHDTHWLANLADHVQDAGYIVRLAERSAAQVAEPLPQPTRQPRSLRRGLSNTLLDRNGTHGEFPDGRQYRIDDVSVLQDSRVLRTWLRLEDGQTVAIDLRAEQKGEGRLRSRSYQGYESRLPGAAPEKPGNDDVAAIAHHEFTANPHPSAPAQTPSLPQRGATITLATRSLTRSATFYAQLTGREIPARAGTAEISPGLLIHQVAENSFIDSTSVIVQFTVDSLSATIRRLGLNTNTGLRNNDTIEVRDPDGRIVRISQGHTG